MTPTGILSFVSLLPYKYDGKGKKGLGLQGQKPLGQCYFGSAVHYWAILAVTPTGILSFVALLTNKYDGKGQKGLGSQGQKPLGQYYLGSAVHY